MSDDVTLREYADMVSGAAIYREAVEHAVYNLPRPALVKLLSINYAAGGLAGEAGEVANKVKKIIRDNGGLIDENVRERVLGELGGVAWYLNACASEFGFRIEDVLNYNYNQIKGRQERGTLQGDGDNR